VVVSSESDIQIRTAEMSTMSNARH